MVVLSGIIHQALSNLLPLYTIDKVLGFATSTYALAGLSERQLAYGYREFQPLIDKCQFNDCRHLKDKGYAVLMAVENGEISKTRYQRFLKLREKMPTAFV